jgi:hypothetical protein
VRGLAGVAALQAVLLNDVGESVVAPSREPRTAKPKELDVAARKPLRSRTVAWWAAGLMLLAVALAAARFSPEAAAVISAAISLHTAG